MIRELEEETGATIEIEDDGVTAWSDRVQQRRGLAAAKERIILIVFPPEAEVGEDYEGEVVNITKFGAFVNILPGSRRAAAHLQVDGGRRVDQVEDELALGDNVEVVVREIDDRGKVSLDLAEALEGATLPRP